MSDGFLGHVPAEAAPVVDGEPAVQPVHPSDEAEVARRAAEAVPVPEPSEDAQGGEVEDDEAAQEAPDESEAAEGGEGAAEADEATTDDEAGAGEPAE